MSDDFTKRALGVMADLDQFSAEDEAGDPKAIAAVRTMLKRMIDISDGPKLQFWMKAVGMVAKAAIENARKPS